MEIKLRAPTAGDVEQVRRWRNDDGVRAGLRTPFLFTEEMQEAFYDDVVCDRRSPHRYWSFDKVVKTDYTNINTDGSVESGTDEYLEFAAFGGLTDIAWENGHAEISLIVSPDHAGQGVGSEAVALILREAFERMRLLTVFGECYENNPAFDFWQAMIAEHDGDQVFVPYRKFWDDELHGATLFWFTAPWTRTRRWNSWSTTDA